MTNGVTTMNDPLDPFGVFRNWVFDFLGSNTALPPEPQETDWHDLHRAYFYPHGREEDYGEDK